MKAITLHPEWCFCICRLDKIVENRTWKPPEALLGQRIAIHAGKNIGGCTSYTGRLAGLHTMVSEAKVNHWGVDHLGGYSYYFTKGTTGVVGGLEGIQTSAVVATAILAECSKDFYNLGMGLLGWQADDQYHWLLEDVRVLPQPIPAKGRLGFWEVPGELEERIDP